MTRPDLTLAREFEAALAWWQAAGVDCDFVDDATAWLANAPLDAPMPSAASGGNARSRVADPSPQKGEARTPRTAAPFEPAPEPAATSRRNLLGDSPPADLAAFHTFWMEASDLAPATGFARVPPHGMAGAPLMVLVPQPEAGDTNALLSGPQGRLLSNILAAMGLDESAVYIASALPAHTPMADLPGLAAAGLDAVTLHHIGLVAPQRLIVLGTGLAPMLGSADPGSLREINHAGRKVPVMLSETLDAMMDMPRLKSRFWRRWIAWSATV